MAVKVFIKRRYPKDREKELLSQIRKIRKRVADQSGYISGEYLKAIDRPNEIVTISSWFSLEDWQAWIESEERKAIEADISAIEGIESEFTVYRNIKTR
ncbi:MAG: antibiotic biosynthesis monooxygenase family protein [Desulfosalsimonadaceae bacterium]